MSWCLFWFCLLGFLLTLVSYWFVSRKCQDMYKTHVVALEAENARITKELHQVVQEKDALILKINALNEENQDSSTTAMHTGMTLEDSENNTKSVTDVTSLSDDDIHDSELYISDKIATDSLSITSMMAAISCDDESNHHVYATNSTDTRNTAQESHHSVKEVMIESDSTEDDEVLSNTTDIEVQDNNHTLRSDDLTTTDAIDDKSSEEHEVSSADYPVIDTESTDSEIEAEEKVTILDDKLSQTHSDDKETVQDTSDESAQDEQALDTASSLVFDKAEAKKVMGKNVIIDDLQVIEGIGPKIKAILHEAGITTWQQLADTSVDTCKSILHDAGSRFQMHDPSSWPKQSDLAARSQWSALADIQGRKKTK